MKVLVAVKEVAVVKDEFEIDDARVNERYLEYDLNEWDEYAIEAAVQLAEAGIADEIVTVTIGPERCEETIRMALAKGADRAIRIWDDAIDAVDLLSVASKVAMLESVVTDEEPDIILTGVQADDDIFGATGVSLAKSIDYSWAAVVNALEVESDTGKAHVRRELEGGTEEITIVDLPTVLTIQTGINEPRYASLRGIRMAQRKEIATKTLADLQLDETILESPLLLTSMREPQPKGDTTIFEGSAVETATQLAAMLREKGVGAS